MERKNQENPFLNYIHNRIERNKNCIMPVVGGTGSGKSYSALRLAEVLDPNFNVDRVAFTAKEFLELIKQDLPSGSAIVFDEMGVAWNARKFMSNMNQILSCTLQTIRYKNHIIFMTVPDLSFIDTHGRKLAHMILETNGMSRRSKLCYIKPFVISTNKKTGKIYYVYPMMKTEDGLVKIKKLAIKLPSVKLRHAYEKKKHAYSTNLYEKTYDNIVGGIKKPEDSLNEKEKTILVAERLKVDPKDVAKQLKISRQSLYNIRSKLRRQGHIK